MEAQADPRDPKVVPNGLVEAPKGSKGVPIGSPENLSKPQATPRDPKEFCNKNKQIS